MTRFAAEVGMIELDSAMQAVGAVTLRHGVHDLVVHQPGGGVDHTELAPERQRRQPGLGLVMR